MTDIKIRIGKRIKELRNSIGISQEQLGFKAELDRTYITGVESGKRNISIVALEKIILALDTNYTQFFNTEIFK
jgi:transcriptional regulator with XRE-family HTH domain